MMEAHPPTTSQPQRGPDAQGRQERALVVGGTGQIGVQILRCLGESSSICASRRANAANCIQIDLGELSTADACSLLAAIAPTVVYCVGGFNDVEGCESASKLAMRINCDGPARLAQAAAARNLPFVHFSTDYIFDGESGPYVEEDQPNPINVYGRSKWAGEVAINGAHPSPLIVRTTVVYGPDQGEKNFLFTLRRTLNTHRKIRVATDQVSTPTYNRDLASNTIALVQSGANGVIHICGPERLSRYEFARYSAELMGITADGIVGAPTSQLSQRARRPLSAGLVSNKLTALSAHISMRTIREAVRDWMTE